MANGEMFRFGGAIGLATGGMGGGGAAAGRAGGGGTGRVTRGGAGIAGRGGFGGGATGRGGGGGTGRAAGGGGGATGLGGATAGCPGAGGATLGGAVAGKGVPQYPQNLLPNGNDLLHFGHITWGAAGARTAGVGGVGGAGPVGFPQRAQVVADAAFMPPQEAQRMYRTVPCSFASAVMVYTLLVFTCLYSPVAPIQMGLV